MEEGGEIEEPVDEGPAAPSVLDQGAAARHLSGGRLDIVERPNEWDLGGSAGRAGFDRETRRPTQRVRPTASAIPDPDSGGLTVVSLPSSPVSPKTGGGCLTRGPGASRPDTEVASMATCVPLNYW